MCVFTARSLPHNDNQFHHSVRTMYLVALAWGYVVLMMAVAEATAPNGTVLGAVFTFLLYGALPLSIVLYILGTPSRRRGRLAAASFDGSAPKACSTSAPTSKRRGPMHGPSHA